MESKAEKLITALIAAMEFKDDASVRVAALQSIAVVMNLPYPALHPFVRKVNKALQQGLDDPKRAVRLEAGKSRKHWNPI